MVRLVKVATLSWNSMLWSLKKYLHDLYDPYDPDSLRRAVQEGDSDL